MQSATLFVFFILFSLVLEYFALANSIQLSRLILIRPRRALRRALAATFFFLIIQAHYITFLWSGELALLGLAIIVIIAGMMIAMFVFALSVFFSAKTIAQKLVASA